MTSAHQPTANMLRTIAAAADALAAADADRAIGRLSANFCAASLRQAAGGVLDGIAVRHPEALVGATLDLDGADMTVVAVAQRASVADEGGFICTVGSPSLPGAAWETLPAWAVVRALVTDDPAHIAFVCRRVATNLARPARHRFHVATPRTRLALALADATALARSIEAGAPAMDVAEAMLAIAAPYPDLLDGATLVGLDGGEVVGSTAGDDGVPIFAVRRRDGTETDVGAVLLVAAHSMGRPRDALLLALQLQAGAYQQLRAFARRR